MVTHLIKRFLVEESGQAIVEYGAILAFVAVLVAMVFTATTGGLRQALSAAFSTIVSQVNNMAAHS